MPTYEAQKRATQKYQNGKWRPSVFIDPNLRSDIESHFSDHGYKSFNEYVIALINKDMGIE